jgi:hypothetical protein
MVRTRRDVNPTFDDPESFFLEVKTGVIRANIGDIGNFLNRGGVAGSPLTTSFGSIYNLKLGSLSQAALGGKRAGSRDRLFMDIKTDNRTAGGSGDPQGRASSATGDIQQALPSGKVEPLQKLVLLA